MGGIVGGGLAADNNLMNRILNSLSLSVTVSIWSENSFKKLKLTFYEIGLEVVKQVVCSSFSINLNQRISFHSTSCYKDHSLS